MIPPTPSLTFTFEYVSNTGRLASDQSVYRSAHLPYTYRLQSTGLSAVRRLCGLCFGCTRHLAPPTDPTHHYTSNIAHQWPWKSSCVAARFLEDRVDPHFLWQGYRA